MIRPRFLHADLDSLTASLSGSPGWLSRPRLAGLHRVPPPARGRRALAAAAAQALVSAHVRIHLAGEDSCFRQSHLLFPVSLAALFLSCGFSSKVLATVVADPPPGGSGRVGHPPGLLVHSSLCGDAAES